MTITNDDIKLFKGDVTSDSDPSSNGGRISNLEVVSGAAANLFPGANTAEREAGSLKMRKVFFRIMSDNADALTEPKIWLDRQTPGEDDVHIIEPDSNPFTSREDDLTFGNPWRGCGTLQQSVIGTDTELVVDTERADIIIFHAGDTIRITDMETPDDTGNEEYKEIDSVVYDGAEATIQLVTGLSNGYSNTNTRVMSVMEPATIEAGYSDEAVDSSGGTFDFAELVLNNRGTIFQTWTATFEGGTDWNVTGDSVGDLGTFDTTGEGGDLAPNNPDVSRPYFALGVAGFGGAFDVGNTIVFTTTPAAFAFWMSRSIPPGADPLSNNTTLPFLRGEAF